MHQNTTFSSFFGISGSQLQQIQADIDQILATYPHNSVFVLFYTKTNINDSMFLKKCENCWKIVNFPLFSRRHNIGIIA